MSRREFDEVWDRDLMRQRLGELRNEAARLKDELARARKTEDKTGRETSELRRLVQDGHLREKHLSTVQSIAQPSMPMAILVLAQQPVV